MQNGRYSGIEVASKTDDVVKLEGRVQEAIRGLPVNVQGGVKAIDYGFSFGLPTTISGVKTIGASSLPLSYGMRTAFGLDALYQGGKYFSDLGGGGAGMQTLSGISPR